MSYQVGDAFERTLPRAPYFSKGLFGVATQASPFPRFVSLWVPIYPLILARVMANTRNLVMQSMDSTLHDPHAVWHEMILLSASASIFALTRKQIGKTDWHSKSHSDWNEALREMVPQKRHLPDMIFKTVWKNNSKMFECYIKKNKR